MALRKTLNKTFSLWLHGAFPIFETSSNIHIYKPSLSNLAALTLRIPISTNIFSSRELVKYHSVYHLLFFSSTLIRDIYSDYIVISSIENTYLTLLGLKKKNKRLKRFIVGPRSPQNLIFSLAFYNTAASVFPARGNVDFIHLY